MATFDMKAYARRGAEVRLRELQEEMAAIHAAFPDLRGTSRGKVVVNHEEQATGAVRRRKWKMTAAQKKAVGERMRKYWAARRKAELSARKQ